MLNNINSKFLLPNKEYRRLSLLYAISESSDRSQHNIGKITNLSSSMVNNYIKSFKAEGLINVTGETNRTQKYHLTPEGEKLLSESVLSYSAEVIQIYGTVKREITKILNGFYDDGIKTVVLFGAAETAEVVFAASKETPLEVTGVVDSDKEKQGKIFDGYTIESPERISKIKPDGVIITSFAKQEEIYYAIKKMTDSGIKVKKLSTV